MNTSENDWDALDCGYMKPENLLEFEFEVAEVRNAYLTLQSFFVALDAAGLRPEM